MITYNFHQCNFQDSTMMKMVHVMEDLQPIDMPINRNPHLQCPIHPLKRHRSFLMKDRHTQIDSITCMMTENGQLCKMHSTPEMVLTMIMTIIMMMKVIEKQSFHMLQVTIQRMGTTVLTISMN